MVCYVDTEIHAAEACSEFLTEDTVPHDDGPIEAMAYLTIYAVGIILACMAIVLI